MITGFHHVCVKTRDWERTLRFYRDVLGCTVKIAWNFRETGRRAIMLDTGDGNYMEIFEDPDYVPAPNGAIFHFALRTKQLDAVAAAVRAFGAKITVEPKNVTIETTNGAGPIPIRIFFCEGPNGEVIEFFQNEKT
jgi:glyoxylase I family protein